MQSAAAASGGALVHGELADKSDVWVSVRHQQGFYWSVDSPAPEFYFHLVLLASLLSLSLVLLASLLSLSHSVSSPRPLAFAP